MAPVTRFTLAAMILFLAAPIALAGPNAGGVLWVHDTGMAYSTDPVVTVPPDSTGCPGGVDNQQPLGDGSVDRIWKVYAAFPQGSHPRLKSCGWAIQFPDNVTSPESYVNVTNGVAPDEDGEGTDFWLGDAGFPTASGGQIGQSFPHARLNHVVPLFWFWGFGYNASGPLPIFSTVPHSNPENRIFVDDYSGTPGHPQPSNEDPIMGYGSLGFGTPGTTPCPASEPLAACCTFPVNPAPGDSTVTCRLRKQADCPAPSTWHEDWYTCGSGWLPFPGVPMPCPAPTGACCYWGGNCWIVTLQHCSDGFGTYQGNFVPCDPTPCPVPAACCFPSGSCLMSTEVECPSPRIWHPEWTSCTPNPCPPPPDGACCVSSGVCTVRKEAACLALPGTIWYSEWTSCDPNPCPQPCPIVTTGLPLTLLLSGVYLDGVPVQLGDLLCVTDVDQDSLPVGATTLDGTYPLAITAWQGDPGFGLPGAACGDAIGYRLRVSATGATYTDVVAVYTTGDGLFCGEPYTTVALWFGNPPSTGFTRGDVDASGELNISDPICNLAYQFAGEPPPPCLDAADDDNSGEVNISDPIYSLSYQFAGGLPPTAPFPNCGSDPTPDPIGCDQFQPCDGKVRPALPVAKVVDGSMRLLLETVPGTSRDSLSLKVTVVTDVPLAGLEGVAGFDPSRLQFVRLVKSGSGPRMDFLSARDVADPPRVRLGGVPDFGLTEVLEPGTYEIGRLVFARRGVAASLNGAVWLTEGRFVGRDLQAYRIEGGSLVDPTIPGMPGGESAARPVSTTLRVTPNPFTGSTVLYLAGPSTISARVLIFDAAGRLVRTAWEGSLDGREVTIAWDGKDQSGRMAPAGIYLVRVESAAGEATGRLVKTQ